MRDVNCFYNSDVVLEPYGEGALSGFTFAAKDLFDVEGHVCACGNPTWAATHSPAEATAPLILELLEHGARLEGKTHMNELAFALDGKNIHYGMPLNPKYPERIPAGSSSGSASAVAAGEVDFALGTDTGGSIRIPAGCCSIFGIRPTHGLLSLEHVMALSQSFDVAGWFADDPDIFNTVADVLLSPDTFSFDTVILVEDVYAMTDQTMRPNFDRAFNEVAGLAGKSTRALLAENGLEEWRDVFREIQCFEVWDNHGDWFTRNEPLMSDEIAGRIRLSAEVSEDTYRENLEKKDRIAALIADVMGDNALLAMPTVPGPVPMRGESHQALEDFRFRTFKATSIAGLAGAPQVSIPCHSDFGPFGFSLIGPRHSDHSLVEFAMALHKKF